MALKTTKNKREENILIFKGHSSYSGHILAECTHENLRECSRARVFVCVCDSKARLVDDMYIRARCFVVVTEHRLPTSYIYIIYSFTLAVVGG